MSDSTIEPTSEAETELLPAAEVMDADQAHRLDSRIRLLSNTIADNLAKLTDLIAEAKRGQIHLALGFPSWTAYLSSALSHLEIALASPARRELVTLLADEGMSNRAIAQAVGVSEITVRRDKEQVRHDVAPKSDSAANTVCPVSPKLAARREWWQREKSKVVGLDGKTYTPPRITTAGGPPRRRPITDAFADQARKVSQASESLERFVRDDRFGRNVDTLSARLSDLVRARDALDRIIAQFDGTEMARLIAMDRNGVKVTKAAVLDSADVEEV